MRPTTPHLQWDVGCHHGVGKILSGENAVRLLVVEDELDLLRALEKAFREEGYAVDTAWDGEDGLLKATSWTTTPLSWT